MRLSGVRLDGSVNSIADGAATLNRRAFVALNRLVLPMLGAGLGNPLPIGVGAVVVETTGRVTGERRRVPLLSWRCGNRFIVSTGRSNSQWFANLEADPSARVQVHGSFRDANASLTRGALNVATLDLTE